MSLPSPPDPLTQPDAHLAEPPMAQPAAAEAAPAPRLHPLLRALLYLLAFIGVSLVGETVALLFRPVAEVFAGPQLPHVRNALLMLVVFASAAPLLVLVTGAFLRHLDRLTFADIGARWPQGGPRAALRQLPAWWGVTALALVLWLAAMVVVTHLAGGSVTFGGWHPSFLAGSALWPGLGGSFLLLALLLGGFAIQSASEEWMFRGYLQRTLQERWPWYVSVLLCSAVFGLSHASNPSANPAGLINTFLVGITFALLVEITGSLWGASLVHGAWNFLVCTFLSLPVSGVQVFPVFDLQLHGPDWVTGGDYGPEASVLLTVMLILINLWLWRRLAAKGSD